MTSNVYHYLRNDDGRYTLGSDCASAKNGAISSALYPAIPQPMGVTRKVSSGWDFAKLMKRSTAARVLGWPSRAKGDGSIWPPS